METLKCKWCQQEKPIDSFDVSRSRTQCLECRNARMRVRYREKYRQSRMKERTHQRTARKRLGPRHSPLELAYMAGIIDGEGTISLHVHGSMGGTSMRVGRVTLFVSVPNTSMALMRWIADRWPASISRLLRSEKEPNKKMAYRWALNANNALHFLDEVYPYLLIKRPQAKLAIRFQRYLQYKGKIRGERQTRLQQEFALAVKRLNHRGLRPFAEPTG